MMKCAQWIVDQYTYADGDENITRRYVYVALVKKWTMRYWSWKHDGLPVRQLRFGPIEIGWGKTHEWICKDEDE